MKPDISPRHREALELKERLTEEYIHLDEERNYLLHHQGPVLEAIYLQCVGKYKLELMELRAETFRLKLKMEFMQASINRGEKINLALIEDLVEMELQEELKKVRAAAQKLAEALNNPAPPAMNEEESREFKKLYYRLAKKLHPDLNPEQNAETKAVWNHVMEAYKKGDLEKLRILDDVLFPLSNEQQAGSVLEELQNRNERLAANVRSLIHQIETIKGSFPWQYKEFLDDAQWVIGQNNQSLNNISKLRDDKLRYEKMIEELLKLSDESGAD